jgi:16S rRNA (cytosine967-C5)-methyltransferase
MTPSARIAGAIDLLTAIRSAPNRPADAVAAEFFRARRYIGAADRREISERVWFVLRAWRRLNFWLGEGASPRMLIAAAALLQGARLSTVEALFSGTAYAPPPLSPGERVLLARLEGRGLEHAAMPEPVRLEIPDWLSPLLMARFGADLVAEMTAMAAPAPLDLRANLLKVSRDQARAALAVEGIATKETPYSPWGLRAFGRHPVTAGEAFRTGLVEIQDEASQLVALLVDARPGMRVVDFCAGAGGKTLALAMAMQNRGQLVACDVSATRLSAAVRRLRRAGVHNAAAHVLQPGDKWLKRHAASFARVLVDAPCTGTGTWRRNPDARLTLRHADLAELLPKQAALLDQAARLVKPGGRLIYATCSLLLEENELQVRAFLERHAGFSVLPLEQAWPLPAGLPCPGPFLSLTPARHGTDGFFAAVLERREGEPSEQEQAA